MSSREAIKRSRKMEVVPQLMESMNNTHTPLVILNSSEKRHEAFITAAAFITLCRPILKSIKIFAIC